MIYVFAFFLMTVWWRVFGPDEPTLAQTCAFLLLCCAAFLNAWCVGRACDEEDEGEG